MLWLGGRRKNLDNWILKDRTTFSVVSESNQICANGIYIEEKSVNLSQILQYNWGLELINLFEIQSTFLSRYNQLSRLISFHTRITPSVLTKLQKNRALVFIVMQNAKTCSMHNIHKWSSCHTAVATRPFCREFTSHLWVWSGTRGERSRQGQMSSSSWIEGHQSTKPRSK